MNRTEREQILRSIDDPGLCRVLVALHGLADSRGIVVRMLTDLANDCRQPVPRVQAVIDQAVAAGLVTISETIIDRLTYMVFRFKPEALQQLTAS